jgi:hypothetical protein
MENMNLLCLSDFNQGDITAKAGELCYFAPIVADRLIDSWPACWAVAPIVTVEEVVTEAIDAPPVDKMMREPTKAKGKRRG